MKANWKKWRYVPYIVTAALALASISLSAEAADIKKSITIDKIDTNQKTTADKINSRVNITGNTVKGICDSNRSFLTVGVADILRTHISTKKDEIMLKAVAKIQEAPKEVAKQEESTLVMAKVNQYVNMRQEADQNAERVGVLYKDCGGTILEKKAEWTKVTSGNVTGWVKNDYLYFGNEAEAVAKEVGMLTAYSLTQTLRVRKEASLNSSVLGLLANGEAVEAIAEEGEWVSVNYEGKKGYVSAEYVRVEFDIDKAESIEVIKAREEEEKKRAAAAAAAKRIQQKEAVLATATEVEILAALIQCEAGGEPYEGQVAVGAVVMNRVRSGGYPNTITDVIYASGQFAPAAKGKMESLILNKTTKASCIQAANEVINGKCNVGDALHFRRNNGRDGIVIGNHVFW